jgi:hypothetical protein
VVEYLLLNLKVKGSRPPCANYFSVAPPENSGGAENSLEKSGPDAKNFFCSMYEMSQRHPVRVAENHVKPCNSAECIIPLTYAVGIPSTYTLSTSLSVKYSGFH